MDKKKIILSIVLAILVVFVIVILILKSHKENEIKVVSKPINESLDLEQVIEKIEEIEGMATYSGEEKIKEDREDEIDFEKYNALEKKVIMKTTEENVNEVWLIKLGEYNQQEDVCRILGNRIRKLKTAFKDKKEQLSIIENAVIKQEDGIVIMIISKDAKEIEKQIADQM